jgi:fluoroquinolone transport system permease protein
MKRFASLFTQDLLLVYRNGFVLVNGVILALMVALVLFLPERLGIKTAEFVYDGTPDKALQSGLLQSGTDLETFYDSRSEMETALADANRGIGIVFEGSVDEPEVTFLTNGRIADENVNVLGATVDSIVAGLQGITRPDNFNIQLLRQASEPVPDNLAFLPIGIVFEVVLLGFMFGAVLIFQEKQEGTNRAFRVSPAGTWSYIWSKNVMFALMSLIYGGILLLVAFQFRINYGRILLLILLTSSLMTLSGLAIAVFFNNISEWFFVGVGVLIINLLPSFS